MSEIKLGFNAGHGLFTFGKEMTSPQRIKEWELNARIVSKVIEELSYYQCRTFRYDDPTGKRDIPLAERTTNANNDDLDFYLAIHHNAGIYGGTGGGTVVFRHPESSQKSVEYQKLLYDSIIKFTKLKGNRSNPLATGNFHEVRETKMPSLLLENGFMDSAVDAPIILTEEHAERTVDGIMEFLINEFRLVLKIRELQKFMKGEDVADWQRILLAMGYKLPEYGVDGSFGNETERATRSFQSFYALNVTGIVDATTRAKANEILHKPQLPAPAPEPEKKDTILPDDMYFRVVTHSTHSRNSAESKQALLKEKGIDSFLTIFRREQ